MTAPDDPSVDLPVSETTASQLKAVMAHCGVSLEEALRLLIGWGYGVVFAPVVIARDEVVLRRGDWVTRVTVLDVHGQEIRPAPIAWRKPRTSIDVHAFRQSEMDAGLATLQAVCTSGPYRPKKLRVNDKATRCHACCSIVHREFLGQERLP